MISKHLIAVMITLVLLNTIPTKGLNVQAAPATEFEPS